MRLLAVPMPWGCLLHNEALIGVPVTMDALGNLSFAIVQSIAAPVTLQAAATDGTTIAMSNGLAF